MAADFDLGGLSWLAETMKSTTAVTRLAVDEDGAVLLTTSDGQRFMAIPGRGSGGNDEDCGLTGRHDILLRSVRRWLERRWSLKRSSARKGNKGHPPVGGYAR
jgi:hypothetical protein